MKNQEAVQNQKASLHIFAALVAGFVVGWILFRVRIHWPETWLVSHLEAFWINGLIQLLGQAFIALLKVLVVPLVFFSLICGVCASGSGQNVSRIGVRTFIFYLSTTALAISLALLMAFLVNPGQGAALGQLGEVNLAEPPSLYQVLLDIFPKNIFQAMTTGNMLQIIVFSILLGIGLLKSQSAGERLLAICEDCNSVMLRLIELVMKLAPVGVFSLVAFVFSTKGVGFMLPLILYVGTVLLALLIHAGFTYSALLKFFTGASPLQFIKKMHPALLFGFSTASSAATLPVTLKLIENEVGVRNSVASFTVPLGATLNMDGTAIMQGVATVFIAGAYGVDLVFTDYLMVILTATLASIGTAAVPSAGLVTLSLVLFQVGLPVEAIGVIIGVDRILDMTRTAINILGDATVTTIVAHQESLWNREVFETPLNARADQ